MAMMTMGAPAARIGKSAPGTKKTGLLPTEGKKRKPKGVQWGGKWKGAKK